MSDLLEASHPGTPNRACVTRTRIDRGGLGALQPNSSRFV